MHLDVTSMVWTWQLSTWHEDGSSDSIERTYHTHQGAAGPDFPSLGLPSLLEQVQATALAAGDQEAY